MNKAQADHLTRLHELNCCLCGAYPVEAHHINQGRTFGKRDKLHFCCIPLCPSCHRGSSGVHGDKAMLKLSKKDELEHLSDTLEKMYGTT